MRMFRALGLLALSAILVSIVPSPSCADSWELPTTTTYTSCTGQARITVSPRDLESQLGYFEDRVNDVDPAGQRTGGSPVASARLERLVDGRWQPVWEHRIGNNVAPVWVLVRNDGEYAVTFDDWHGTGYGPNAVVIYAAGGRLIRALALPDIIPPDYIEALPHSVSSIDWRGEPRFSSDGRRVIIPVVIPSEDFESNPATIDIAVNLADGRVSPMNPDAWDAAQATGRRVLAAQLALEAAQKAAFLAPLLGPTQNTEGEWHEYLREAVARLIGDGDAESFSTTPSTTVLRFPGMEDYAASEAWVRDALTVSYADKVALASLSEPNLVAVLKKVISELPDRSLSNVTAFIAVSDRYWPEVVAVMRSSGAKIVQLDPAQAIPQRPERIARRYGPAGA